MKQMPRSRWNPQHRPLSQESSPVVIGSIGGSGTRILTQVFSLCGISMGQSVDLKTWDSLPMRNYLRQEFTHLADVCLSSSAPSPSQQLENGLRSTLITHRGNLATNEKWGWKNPRNMWLIPILANIFPAMRFVLLVRDGRDVALSSNKFLLKHYGSFLLSGQSFPNDELAQLALWEKGTRFAIEKGNALLGENFIVIRYEDLCLEPISTLERTLQQLEVPNASRLASSLAHRITPSPGMGRGKAHMQDIESPGALELLKQLDYID